MLKDTVRSFWDTWRELLPSGAPGRVKVWSSNHRVQIIRWAVWMHMLGEKKGSFTYAKRKRPNRNIAFLPFWKILKHIFHFAFATTPICRILASSYNFNLIFFHKCFLDCPHRLQKSPETSVRECGWWAMVLELPDPGPSAGSPLRASPFGTTEAVVLLFEGKNSRVVSRAC